MTTPLTEEQQLRVACPYSKWAGVVKHCQWCNTLLVGATVKRRKTWCSDECFQLFQQYHVWSHAKDAALVTAHYKCEIKGCKAAPEDIHVVHTSPLPKSRYAMGCHHHPEQLIVICTRHRKEYANRLYW